MAQLTKIFNFQNGPEGFVHTSGSSYGSGEWSGSEGNPAGCLLTRVEGRNRSSYNTWVWQGTFEDLGIPAGSSINSFGNRSIQWNQPRIVAALPTRTIFPVSFRLVALDTVFVILPGRLLSPTPQPWSNNIDTNPLFQTNWPSDTVIEFIIVADLANGNNGSAISEVGIDNFEILINYTPGAPPEEHTLNLNDSISTSDQLSSSKGHIRNISDAVSASDQNVRQSAIARNLSDSITASDQNVPASVFVKQFSDIVSIQDEDDIPKGLPHFLTFEDQVSISDQQNTARSIAFSLTDQIAISAIVNDDTEFKRTIQDISVTTDQLNTAKQINRSLADTVTVSDSENKTKLILLGLNDTVSASEHQEYSREINVAFNEQIEISAIVNDDAEFKRTIQDLAETNDQLNTTKQIKRSLADSIEVTDSIQTDKVILLSLAETISVSDFNARVQGFNVLFQELIEISAIVNDQAEFQKTIQEEAFASDQIDTLKEFFLNFNDTANLSDDYTVPRSIFKTFHEIVSLSDFHNIFSSNNLTSKISVLVERIALEFKNVWSAIPTGTGICQMEDPLLDWAEYSIFVWTVHYSLSFAFINLQLNKTITLIISGEYTISFPAYCKKMSGTYDGETKNYIQLHCTNNAIGNEEVWFSISQQIV